jgi:4-hydroxy 2-oxovalerate aldolase
MKKKIKIKIIDCTCRDGGYYNSWNFNITEVNEYLKNCSLAKIDYVEIGFSFPKREKKLGLFAYSSEFLFKKLKIPKNLKICVMINAKDYYDKNHQVSKKKIYNNFSKNLLKHFNIIRIAINFDEYILAKKIAKDLKIIGFTIGINLMQSHNKTKSIIKTVCKNINSWKTIKFLYFADSLGIMEPEYVKNLFTIAKKFWKRDIGIHAHNNKTYALINTLSALKYGANMLDSTMLGMGRGAGNVATETLLIELEKLNYKYKSKFLTYSIPYFEKLKIKYNWGPNFLYHYSANKNIHPTYIQKLISEKKYSNDQIHFILKELSNQKSGIFSEDILDNQTYKLKKIEGSFDASHYFSDKEVLIAGAGTSGKNELSKVLRYIKKKKPTVLSLNINPYLPNKVINYYISCYDYRVYFELKEILSKGKSIIIPIKKFKNFIKYNKKSKIINYDLVVKKNSFISEPKYCVLDKPLALLYALAFCQVAKPKKIMLAFIDGSQDNKLENLYLKNQINKFIKSSKINTKFLTKTTLN